MIPLETLKAIKTIVVHDKCPDGIASALILKDVLPQAKVIFCQYSTPEHEALAAEPGMIFADFSPHRSRVQEFIDAGAIVLDHHKTQKETVALFGERGIFGDEVADPGVSGAVLAYREVWQRLLYETHQGDYRPDPDFVEWVGEFARIAGIRDTWQKQSPDWQYACIQSSALFFAPQDELLKEGLHGLWANWEDRYEWAGRTSFVSHRKRVARAVREGFQYVTPNGSKMLVFQGTKLSSDAAEDPGADGFDIICGFDVVYEGGQVKYLYSCRSRNGYDVSALAKRHGGGGHKAAAGFNVATPGTDPYARFIIAVEMHEAEQAAVDEVCDRR